MRRLNCTEHFLRRFRRLELISLDHFLWNNKQDRENLIGCSLDADRVSTWPIRAHTSSKRRFRLCSHPSPLERGCRVFNSENVSWGEVKTRCAACNLSSPLIASD